MVSKTVSLDCVGTELSEARKYPTMTPNTGTSVRLKEVEDELGRWRDDYLSVKMSLDTKTLGKRPR